MRDGESNAGTDTGQDYFNARYLWANIARFTSPDPSFLNILKVVNPQRWNLYGYAVNNPLKFVDTDGREAIAIYYPGYQVAVRKNYTLPLGHAGVVMVAKDGSTHYFEYGRYAPAGAGGDLAQGIVRNAGPTNAPTPALQRDASGKFTPESMKALLATLSNVSGKGGAVDVLVFDTATIEDAVMEAYLNDLQRQKCNPNRQHYSPFSHNCGTLICEAFDRAGHPGPGLFQRWGYTPGGIFELLIRMSGPSQQFSYTPKEKVTSKVYYTDEEGQQKCQ